MASPPHHKEVEGSEADKKRKLLIEAVYLISLKFPKNILFFALPSLLKSMSLENFVKKLITSSHISLHRKHEVTKRAIPHSKLAKTFHQNKMAHFVTSS